MIYLLRIGIDCVINDFKMQSCTVIECTAL
jgi:hypothetical protein